MKYPEAAEFYGVVRAVKLMRDVVTSVWLFEVEGRHFQGIEVMTAEDAERWVGSKVSVILSLSLGSSRHADGEAPGLSVIESAGPGSDADFVEFVGQYLGMEHRGGKFHVLQSLVPVVVFSEEPEALSLSSLRPGQTIALTGHALIGDIRPVK